MNNKLKVLGSVSPYCKGNSNCPGYLIYRNNNKILLDCGSGITSLMNMPNDLENLTIIISHYHKDHYSDIFSLGYASYCYHKMGLLDKKIKVYIPSMNKDEEGYEDYQLIENFKESYFDIEVYDDSSKIYVDDNEISFFKVSHSIKSYSCRIKNSDFSLVYTGDTGYKNIDEYIDFCRNSDYLLGESTYLEFDNKSDENHLHVEETAKIALLSNVKMLILTHFWPEHNKHEYLVEAKKIFENTLVAEENTIIDL